MCSHMCVCTWVRVPTIWCTAHISWSVHAAELLASTAFKMLSVVGVCMCPQQQQP